MLSRCQFLLPAPPPFMGKYAHLTVPSLELNAIIYLCHFIKEHLDDC